ncbi:hypothetical protein [Methylorubrum extorquens]|uniref:hypothetical protein n=1 Tax=Methylorubrum extorquens TaxID=408 RepID=UPI001EE56889|nr:hypothetical protein [Methylorubrum extorquens]MCG5246950.1 hypothetical protein [Methylorubrum extorquens]
MMTSFLSFVGGEAHSYTVALLRLHEEIEYLHMADQLYQELHTHTREYEADESYIVYLAGSCQNRLYTSALAYMRGQRSDAFGICRSAVEAAINAVLMHNTMQICPDLNQLARPAYACHLMASTGGEEK